MTLGDILNSIDTFSDDLVIFAFRNGSWNLEASAALIPLEELENSSSEHADLTYFLEVQIAKDIIDTWRTWRNGKEPSLIERAEAILYYVENDAYLPPAYGT